VRLKLPVRGAGLAEGIEIFPRQSFLRPGEFGNAIRGPLGVHQANKKRLATIGFVFVVNDWVSAIQKQMDARRLEVIGRWIYFLAPHQGVI